jgi:hypothetical protein
MLVVGNMIQFTPSNVSYIDEKELQLPLMVRLKYYFASKELN